MGNQTLDTILHLAAVGYTVRFEKRKGVLSGPTDLEIRLSKGDSHHVEIVDLAHCISVDRLIANALDKSRWELDNFMFDGGIE